MDIHIFWDRDAGQGFQIPTSRLISQILDIPVKFGENPILYNGFDRNREQFDATSILTSIDTYSRRNPNLGPVLLVVNEDIYRPGARYIFGLARPRTSSSVISTARLKNAFWDLPDDDTLLIERMAKEGAHEIGHLFLLEHCPEPSCIMSNPLCLDDLDTKKTWLCEDCSQKLLQHINKTKLFPDTVQ